MDVKQYYKKLRELEARISEPYVVVVSNETPDGGKAGVMTEVPKRNACRLVLEGRARQANAAEAEAYQASETLRREDFERQQAAGKIQFHLVPAAPNQPAMARAGD